MSKIIENKVRFVENYQGNLYPEFFFHHRNNNINIHCHNIDNNVHDISFSCNSTCISKRGGNNNGSRNRNDNITVIVLLITVIEKS